METRPLAPTGAAIPRAQARIYQQLKRQFSDLAQVRFISLSDGEVLVEYRRRDSPRWFALAPREDAAPPTLAELRRRLDKSLT